MTTLLRSVQVEFADIKIYEGRVIKRILPAGRAACCLKERE